MDVALLLSIFTFGRDKRSGVVVGGMSVAVDVGGGLVADGGKSVAVGGRSGTVDAEILAVVE